MWENGLWQRRWSPILGGWVSLGPWASFLSSSLGVENLMTLLLLSAPILNILVLQHFSCGKFLSIAFCWLNGWMDSWRDI